MKDENDQAFFDFCGIKEFEGEKYIEYEKYQEVLEENEENECVIDELKEKLMEAEESLFELPSYPIDVAKMLIYASVKFTNVFGEEREAERYDKQGLRQIAQHLLVYCNNSEGE